MLSGTVSFSLQAGSSTLRTSVAPNGDRAVGVFSEMRPHNLRALFWGPGSNAVFPRGVIWTVSLLEEAVPAYESILHSPAPAFAEVKLLHLQNRSRSPAIR